MFAIIYSIWRYIVLFIQRSNRPKELLELLLYLFIYPPSLFWIQLRLSVLFFFFFFFFCIFVLLYVVTLSVFLLSRPYYLYLCLYLYLSSLSLSICLSFLLSFDHCMEVSLEGFSRILLFSSLAFSETIFRRFRDSGISQRLKNCEDEAAGKKWSQGLLPSR